MGLKEDILAQHTFTFPSLSPNSHSHKQPYIRFLMFLTKRADISDEKFHMWWSTVHADLLLSVKEYGGYASRYVQFHQTAAHKEELRRFGMEPLPYDGIGEMYFRNIDDWIALQKTPAFANLANDGANFMDVSKLKVMIGHEGLIYGSGIATSRGQDGIMPEEVKSKVGGME